MLINEHSLVSLRLMRIFRKDAEKGFSILGIAFCKFCVIFRLGNILHIIFHLYAFLKDNPAGFEANGVIFMRTPERQSYYCQQA